jgi:zinc protease
LQTPGNSTADWAGYTAAPLFSEHQVAGQTYPSLEDAAGGRVLLGDEGATLIDGESVATVRFADCRIMLAWPDGARQLIGGDAISVRLEPTLYHGLAAAIPVLDSRIQPHLRAEMPARGPERIPRPQPRAQPATPPSRPRGVFQPVRASGRKGLIINVVLFGVLALLTGIRAVQLMTGAVRSGFGPDTSTPLVTAVFVLFATGVVLFVRRLIREWDAG